MVSLNMFPSDDKGKREEIRLDPPPLDDHDDHDDHMSDTIDVSDSASYNSGFGSGYSEAGLDDNESLYEEDGAHESGYSPAGPLDDRSSIFDEEVEHEASSNSNTSHHSTPAETSTRPKGPVRFSFKPTMKSISRLRKAPSPGKPTGPTSSKVLCVVRTIPILRPAEFIVSHHSSDLQQTASL